MAIFQEKDKNKITKDGRSWYFSTYKVKLDGTRKKYKSKKFKTKKEAQESERFYLINNDINNSQNNITFKELIDHYVSYQESRVKITTLRNYSSFIKYVQCFNKNDINKITLKMLFAWQGEIQQMNLSLKYKNHIYTFLLAVFRHGQLHFNLNCENILINLKPFKNPNELKKEMDFYTLEEFNTFISYETDIRYIAYFKVLYYCGTRKGEAGALTWEDIDFNCNTIKINKSVAQKIKNEKYVILPPKTKSSIRILPMCKEVKESLKILYSYFSKYNNFSDTWFIFYGIFPIPDTTVQKRRDELCKLSNLRKIRIHDFRHSCASLLINNGANVSLVSKYLGHSNPSVTLNTYTHMFKNELDSIIDTINNLK